MPSTSAAMHSENIPQSEEENHSDNDSVDIETKAKELKYFLHAELRAYFEELESHVDTFDWLYYKITMMSITKYGIKDLNRFFNIAIMPVNKEVQ